MQIPVVTGMGIVSSLGLTTQDFWQQLLLGTQQISAVDWPFSPIQHPIWQSPITPHFDASQWIHHPKILKNSARFTLYALAAVAQALDQAALPTPPALRTAVIIGTSMGGVPELVDAQEQLAKDPQAVSARLMATVIPNMASAQIALLYGLHGPQLTLTNACASSIDALGLAARLIQSGTVDVAIAGGAETLINPVVGYSLFNAHALSQAASAQNASQPFDAHRTGFVMGEGAAILVLESYHHAQQRDAKIFGQVLGYASLADGYHVTSPEPSGTWEALAMRQALEDAQRTPQDIDAIIAHGTSTIVGDRAEIRAMHDVYAHHHIPVTSIKGHLGHSMGASGAMSAIAALYAIQDGMLPPTVGTTELDPEVEFDLVQDKAKPGSLSIIQVNAFGFGGQNASIILSRLLG
ncbi:MAG: beta-ketoacyl-[acyl-carrier-protein] synthase family protein [Sulfobacillus thermosulfidooxidans]|nr:MAG: beta-ketoacyl-[acyl-carrier-protein] synthase family protein [Sulfobacillus thermosulfidooxidans]